MSHSGGEPNPIEFVWQELPGVTVLHEPETALGRCSADKNRGRGTPGRGRDSGILANCGINTA